VADSKRLLTKSEAAAFFGVSRPLISRKFKQGKLVMVDGLVDVEASRGAFGGNGQPVGKPASEQVNAAVASAPERVNGAKSPDEQVESFAEAQRRKESALANLRELEIREKIGELVDVGEMERAWATAGQTLRDGFLALPEQIAPQLAALTDKIEVRDLLRGEIRKILGNLPTQIRNGKPDTQAA
jgi:hypothetical protein